MKRSGFKWIFVLTVFVFVMTASVNAKAATEDPIYTPGFSSDVTLNEKDEICITWFSYYGGMSGYSYEIEVAKDSQFSNPTKFSTEEIEMRIPKSFFGKNGGKYFFRVRTCRYADTENAVYSDWTEPMSFTFIAINKKNFPGLYKILKKGGKSYTLEGVQKEIYDTDKDGFLSPDEIRNITRISTVDVTKKKNGKYYTIKAENVSGLKGIEYLENLGSLTLQRYSGTTIDVSKNKVYNVSVRAVTSKKIKVIAPDAKWVSIEGDINTKLKKIDLSECPSAVDVLAYGNKGTKTLVLPKEKDKMKILSVSDLAIQTFNLNAYKKLEQVYFYHGDVKKVKVNKCTNLKYIYFYFCNKIKHLDVSKNKKLRGADFYSTNGLTKKTVKKPKGAKLTWNKGKWWYYTKKYKKDMKKLLQ